MTKPTQRAHGAFFLLFLAAALFYLLLRSFNYSYDGICYALDVEFGDGKSLLHPNHLFYTPLQKLFFAAARAAFPALRAVQTMVRVNALLAAATVGVLAKTLAEKSRPVVGIAAAVLFGVSATFLKEASDSGCYALGGLAAALLLHALLNADQIPPFWLGALHAVASCLHLMLALAVPAFVLALALQPGNSKTKTRRIGLYLAPFVVGLAAVYGVVVVAFYGGNFLQPFTSSTGTVAAGTWLDLHVLFDAEQFLYSYFHSWIWIEWPPQDGSSIGLSAAVLTVTALALTAAVRTWKAKPSEQWRAVACALWIVTMSALHFFWAVGSDRFRILWFPPLLFLALPFFSRRLQRPAGKIGVAIALLAMGTWNYRKAILPYSSIEKTPSLRRALWVQEQLSPRDFFFFHGSDEGSIINVYAAYFARAVPGRSLKGMVFGSGRFDAAGMNAIYDQTLARGGRFYVDAPLRTPPANDPLVHAMNDPMDFAAWNASFGAVDEKTAPDGYRITALKKR